MKTRIGGKEYDITECTVLIQGDQIISKFYKTEQGATVDIDQYGTVRHSDGSITHVTFMELQSRRI